MLNVPKIIASAREMERIAERARTDELRRSYLILARDWHEMANAQLYDIAPPLAPMGALEQLAKALESEALELRARTTL